MSKETKMQTNVKHAEFREAEKKNQIAIFEEIRKNTDLTVSDPSAMKVPVSMVFGRGTTGNLPSFGNKTLVENSVEVDKALANVGELENIWNHSHSQWAWKHINFSYHSPMKNMRQISAEIARKKSALNEAKWRQIKNEAKIRKIEDELNNSPDMDYWREVDLKIKLAELKEGMVEGTKYIEGAMKDVLSLNEIYEQLKSKVNSFSEHDVEKEETKSHLKRSIVQSIRDVRQSGVISKGEQEYVEQIGVNPMKLQRIIQQYVASEAEQEHWDNRELINFVDQLTEELAEVHKVDHVRMELMGYDPEPTEDWSYTNTLALPHTMRDDQDSEEE